MFGKKVLDRIVPWGDAYRRRLVAQSFLKDKNMQNEVVFITLGHVSVHVRETILKTARWKTQYLDLQAECCSIHLSWKLKHVPQTFVLEIPAETGNQ